ncbi:adenosine deaminase [Pelomyxa schiedti]|nr:adenosine deaminase [Pelomyxa schiedti]
MASTTTVTTTTATKTKLTHEILRRLPKAELHRHLDGSIRPSTIIELAKEQGVELPTMDEAELKKLVSVDETCTSLVQYLRGFDITLKVLQKPYAITRAMYEVCEDAWNDGVRYLEVRFSPILHTVEGMSQGGVMEAVCEGQAMAMYRFPLRVQIIVCAMRQLPATESFKIAEIAWRYRHKGVVAFDLAGPELGFSSKIHKSAFEIIRNKCIHCTIHSGEAAGWESICDSIRYCGANRIGHGVRLLENPALMEYVIDHSIAIECCPTSNVHTKAIARIEEHPIRKFFDAGALTVPCTDNTTVSAVTLTGEYMLLHEKFNFNVEEIVRLLDYGFRSAFLTSTEKRRLRTDCFHDTLRILSQEGYDLSGILAREAYYKSIGVFFGTTGLPMDPPISWRLPQRRMSREFLRLLPKTDLHCRLDGSVSVDLLWKELQTASINLASITGRTITTKEEIATILTTAEASDASNALHNSTAIAKAITRSVLQKADQIERALDDIVIQAVNEGVIYMELVIHPMCHTEQGLTPDQVMTIVNTRCRYLMALHPIHLGIVIHVNTVNDDPIVFKAMAELAVRQRKYKDSLVVGFGCYGDEAIPESSFKYFMSTFEYLKTENMNVSMVAGLQGVGTILQAIREGGASRISGAFHVHTFPRLMNFLASQGIAVELSMTHKLREHTKNATFAGSPVRLFIDNELPITICSFRNQSSPLTRIDVLESFIEDCKLTLEELLKLLSNGFLHNFSGHILSQQLHDKFWVTCKNLAESAGYHMFPINPFPRE